MKVQKTDEGYIIRQGGFEMLSGWICIALAIASAVVLCVADEGNSLGSMVLMGIMAAFLLAVGVWVVILSAGRRLVLDREGVVLRRTFVRKRALRWQDVRDWGLSYEETTSRGYTRRFYRLYFSPIPLETEYLLKKRIRLSAGVQYITVSKQSCSRLLATDALCFCEDRLRAVQSDPTPMFRSNIDD